MAGKSSATRKGLFEFSAGSHRLRMVALGPKVVPRIELPSKPPSDSSLVATELLKAAYKSAGGRPVEALLEEDFLSAEAADLVDASPDVKECCRVIHRRCVLDAVNEALEALAAPPPPPRGQAPVRVQRKMVGSSSGGGLAALLASAREQRNAELPLEEWTKRVLALLHTPSGVHVIGAPEDEDLPDDIGHATRMLWHQLSPEWTDYGEDEWAAARAKLPRGLGAANGANDEEAMEARAKLAAELFWEGRQELLLTDDELHIELWNALRAGVSPPWPEVEAVRQQRREWRRERRKAERAAEKKRLEEEEAKAEEEARRRRRRRVRRGRRGGRGRRGARATAE